jgi:hypothetical protein
VDVLEVTPPPAVARNPSNAAFFAAIRTMSFHTLFLSQLVEQRLRRAEIGRIEPFDQVPRLCRRARLRHARQSEDIGGPCPWQHRPGIGAALYERYHYDDQGQLLTASFAELCSRRTYADGVVTLARGYASIFYHRRIIPVFPG